MPKPPPSDKAVMDRQVKRSMDKWKEEHEADDEKLAEIFGVTRQTISNWRKDSDAIFKKARFFVRILKPSDEEILRMVRPEK